MRVREIADEVTRVARAREPLGHPWQVLDDHVQAAEDEKEAPGDEVLRELPVVPPELLLGIRLGAKRRRAARKQLEHGCDHDREETRRSSGTAARKVL